MSDKPESFKLASSLRGLGIQTRRLKTRIFEESFKSERSPDSDSQALDPNLAWQNPLFRVEDIHITTDDKLARQHCWKKSYFFLFFSKDCLHNCTWTLSWCSIFNKNAWCRQFCCVCVIIAYMYSEQPRRLALHITSWCYTNSYIFLVPMFLF